MKPKAQAFPILPAGMEGSCSEPRAAFSAAWLVLGRSHGFIFVVCVHASIIVFKLCQCVRCFRKLPIVSIVVPFFGYPVLWLGSYNRDFGQPKKGTTMETLVDLCVLGVRSLRVSDFAGLGGFLEVLEGLEFRMDTAPTQ